MLSKILVKLDSFVYAHLQKVLILLLVGIVFLGFIGVVNNAR